jgi:hypothetical protein
MLNQASTPNALSTTATTIGHTLRYGVSAPLSAVAAGAALVLGEDTFPLVVLVALSRESGTTSPLPATSPFAARTALAPRSSPDADTHGSATI